ncbi:MAG: hypothetical protein E4H14_16055 [Candidatus Thorarchaeota archaeon]|nr:MAG: hypothetical protein E4H14_16055 [Candidatus Thorarchaeota archaeon]
MDFQVDKRNLSRSILMNYIVFGILYCLSIMFAVILGVTGRLVPNDSSWYQTLDPLTIADLTTRLSIVFLPMSILLTLNTIRFEGLLKDRTFTLRNVLEDVVIGFFTLLPLLFITVFFYNLLSFFISWPFIVVARTFIVSGFLLTYALALITITASNTRQYLIRLLKNPYTWLAALALGAILMFPTASLINSLSKGFFRFFPSANLFLSHLLHLIFRVLTLGLVLTALSFVLVHLSRVSNESRFLS